MGPAGGEADVEAKGLENSEGLRSCGVQGLKKPKLFGIEVKWAFLRVVLALRQRSFNGFSLWSRKAWLSHSP